MAVFLEGSRKTQGMSDLEAVISDFGSGLCVYFTVTPAFLIIVACIQNRGRVESLEITLVFQEAYLLKLPYISSVAFLPPPLPFFFFFFP